MAEKKVPLEYVSWRKLHLILGELALRVLSDGFKPDIIYAVVKGGLIPARILADFLSVETIGFIGVSFYKRIGEHTAKPELTLPPTVNVRGQDVLIVDDVVESGRTLQLVIEELSRYGAGKIRSLALYVKPWRTYTPDYYYESTTNWLVFPWEIVETYKERRDLEEVLFTEESQLIGIAKKLV